MTTPAAGWFPDPAGRTDSYRWWDGAAWTRYLTTDPTVQGPADAGTQGDSRETASPAGVDRRTGATTTVGSEPSAAPGPAARSATATASPDDDIAQHGTRRGRAPRPMPPGYDLGRPTRRGPVALLVPIGIAIAAGALAVVIAVHARGQSAELLSPPEPVASSAQRVVLSYNEDSGVATMPSLEVTMPSGPFVSDHSDFDIYGIFSDSVQAEATVQHYAKNQSWVAVVDTGVLEDKLVGKDLEATTKNAFDLIVKNGFGPNAKVTVKNLHSAALKSNPDKVWIVNGDVHYKVKGVTSTYDRVNMMVVDIGSGHYVGWLSDRPNKSKPSVKKAIDASIKTIRITG